jgi:hypothetical protein
MNVLTKIERHLRRSGQKPTRFGRNVANDPRLVFDLRQGRAIGARLAARIEAFLEAIQ